MQSAIRERLAQLRAEYATGQKMLADLESQQAGLRQTLLRISGAIQVLVELLEAEPQGVPNAAAHENALTLPSGGDR
jgi:hypothetical protein